MMNMKRLSADIKGRVLGILDSKVFLQVRVLFCVCIMILFLAVAVIGLSQGLNPKDHNQTITDLRLNDLENIATEHRFSVLEMRTEELQHNIADLRASNAELNLHSWLELIGIAGLLGETGVRIAKNKLLR